jgi:hypothetical protein
MRCFVCGPLRIKYSICSERKVGSVFLSLESRRVLLARTYYSTCYPQDFLILALSTVQQMFVEVLHKSDCVYCNTIIIIKQDRLLKNVVFWDVALCRSCVNRRFGGKYHLHLQGRNARSTQSHIPQDDILHSHRCENLNSYKIDFCLLLVVNRICVMLKLFRRISVTFSSS